MLLTKIFHKYLNKGKHFFLLLPSDNKITRESINKYKYGDKYKIKTYYDLYKILIEKHIYKPNGLEANEYQKFIFDEFRKSIEYLTWTTSKQYEYVAYVRLKQKIEKLKSKSK